MFPHWFQLRHFLALFFPLLLTQMAQVGTSVFSSIFSGQAGTIDLAGVAVAVNIWYPVFAGLCGIFFGISPIIAQLRGAQKTEEIPTYIMQSLYLSLGFTAVIFLAGAFLLPPFLDFMGLDAPVRYIAWEYLKALALGLVPICLQATIRYIVDAHGKTHVSMAILVTNLVLTIILFRLLIFGAGPIPAMGGIGTGYAITIASWLSFLLFVGVLQWMEPFRSYHLWSRLRPFSWYHGYHQLELGIPIFIAVFCETSLFSIVGLLMAEFGTLYLAANQAAISFSTLTYTLPWSISLTATIVIGYEVGARNYAAARQYAVLCQMTAFTIAIALIVVTYHFVDHIAAIFTSDAETFWAIRMFIFYAVAFSFFDAAGTPVQGILRGYKDVKIITYVAFVTYWLISIPMGYAMAHVTSYGPYGYWISLIISLAINASALNWRLWKHTAWKVPVLSSSTKE
ncbi:MATE family efflux transporter [Megasphaera sp.]|uniref:MATE family efflux transporter n=3 Tax=Megasphaera sp. TaxID=2023260 RepID=UPI0026112CEA|nr:MATE family efflux transporter [uncultured Megasphaera sp.]